MINTYFNVNSNFKKTTKIYTKKRLTIFVFLITARFLNILSALCLFNHILLISLIQSTKLSINNICSKFIFIFENTKNSNNISRSFPRCITLFERYKC